MAKKEVKICFFNQKSGFKHEKMIYKSLPTSFFLYYEFNGVLIYTTIDFLPKIEKNLIFVCICEKNNYFKIFERCFVKKALLFIYEAWVSSVFVLPAFHSLFFCFTVFRTLQILLFMALKRYYWIDFCFSGDLCSDFCDFAYFRREKYEMKVYRLVKSQVKYTKYCLKLLCFNEKYIEFVKIWNSKRSIKGFVFLVFCVIFTGREREKIKYERHK